MFSRPPRRPSRQSLIVAGVLVALWLLGLVWFRPWVAHDDFAIFRIALERQLDGHIRLVGAHSRLGVFHPGPLREWLFVGPYWAGARSAAALPATALVCNAGWVVWTLVVANRLRPKMWGAACATGLLVVVVALGTDLASPWNPHLAILPMYLSCWALVTVIARDGEGWIACVCAGSFAAQLHASALVVGVVIVVAALVALMIQRWGRQSTGALVLPPLVALALWSGPILDLRRGADSNLIRLRTVGADGVSVGIGDALGHASRLLWPGTPLGRTSVRPTTLEFLGFHRWWLLIVMTALVAIVGTAWRRIRSTEFADDSADSAESARVTLVAGGVATAVVVGVVMSISLFVEPVYRYLYGPLQGAAVFVFAVVLGGLIGEVERVIDRPIPHVGVVAGAVVPVAVSLMLFGVPRDDGDSAGRRALRVDEVIAEALAERPGWDQVEALPLDLRGAGDLDAEILDVVVRRGLDARSRRPEIDLPAPVDADGAFVVSMSPGRDCLLGAADADELIRATSAGGETFSVFAVAAGSDADADCLGAPTR